MKKIITILVVAVLVVVGLFVFRGKGDEATPTPTSTPSTSVSASVLPSVSASVSPVVSASVSPVVSATVSVAPKTVTISYTNAGYVTANITIKKGDTVKFVNNSTKEMWPASAMHPTHNEYPEHNTCFSGVFDGCRVAIGGSFSMKFNTVGAWGYHDHVTPNFFGKITVTN